MLPFINIRRYPTFNPRNSLHLQHSAFEYVASLVGASVDERRYLYFFLIVSALKRYTVKLIFSFLISYPLAGLLKRIPDVKPHQKNLFIILYIQNAASLMIEGLIMALAFPFFT